MTEPCRTIAHLHPASALGYIPPPLHGQMRLPAVLRRAYEAAGVNVLAGVEIYNGGSQP